VPKPVAVKANYREDTAYLVRFETAILKDVDLPEDWRKKFAQAAHELASQCLEADDIKNRQLDASKSEPGKPVRSKR
jgi:hypothetical protein